MSRRHRALMNHGDPGAITEILNVGAPLGVIKERWGATLTNTAVTLFQDGDVNAMEFNGVNSLINCGTMDPLIGDKSFVLWLRGYEYSGPNTFFIGTTIFALAFDTPNDLLLLMAVALLQTMHMCSP